MNGLPQGWAYATVEQLAGAQGLTTDGDWIETKDQDLDGDVRLIQLADIGDGEFRDRSARFVTTKTAHRLNCTFLENGDLLIARMPDPLGRASIFPGVGQPAITAVDVFVWRPGPGCPSSKWLTYFLNSPDVRDRIAEQAGGTTRQRIAGGRVKQLLIPVPPLPEQRRIVTKIDSLSTKSRRARSNLEHIPRLVEKYKRAVLAAAYDGHLASDKKGAVATISIDKLVVSLDQGWSPKCESEPAARGEWAVIKTTAIQPIRFVAGENKKLPPHLPPRPATTIDAGDVLITRAGPRSRVAIACVVRETYQRLMLCDKAYRLRVKTKEADPVFLAYMLNTPQSLDLLEQMKTGISDSGLNLTQSKFLALPVPNFSKDTQREIVRRIERAFAWIDRLGAETASARRLIDRLDEAALATAFSGELVRQDPADQPASMLLERICEAGVTTERRQGRRGRPRNIK